MRKGKTLRLLFLFLAMAVILTGCGGTAEYQAMDLEAATAPRSMEDTAGETVISMGETMADTDEAAGESENASEETTEETRKYEPVDEMVAVTADVLNVRKADSQDAGIYVQLKNGDTLHRTGYNEEWSQVEYDGKTAFVASDMVEVVVEETTEAETAPPEETEPGEAASPEDGQGAEGQPAEGEPAQEANAGDVSAMALDGGQEPEIPWNGHTVAIDAGHQAKANAEKEPIGPSSETMKAKMAEGSVGTASGVPEYELTLTMAKKLEAELKARGYHTVMIRTGHDVNLSNAERSTMANKSGADIFIRLHANSMENSSVYGALTMCMTAQNPYNAGLHDKSYSLSKKIVDSICGQTGTKNRGVRETDNSGELNWCEIPVSIVEMGFLTNPDEDRWLQDENYQDKLVAGIAAAVDAYFAEGN